MNYHFALLMLALACFASAQREDRYETYKYPVSRLETRRRAEEYEEEIRAKRRPQYEDLINQYPKIQPRSSPSLPSSASYRPSLADPYLSSPYKSTQPYTPSSSGYSSESDSSEYNGRPRVDSYEDMRPSRSDKRKKEKQEEDDEEEEEKKPNRLQLLLNDSKFTCSGKKDGYYADNSVNCQVFHYCVSGAKHSWMCPEGTVFHQVHLNCVPASQDICSQSEKFYVVNDYLHKPLDTQGPNNTIRYHQRYYPEEFLGDPNIPTALTGPKIQTFGGSPPPPVRKESYPPVYDDRDSYNDDRSYNPPVSRSPKSSTSYPSSYESYQPNPVPVSYKPQSQSQLTVSKPYYSQPYSSSIPSSNSRRRSYPVTSSYESGSYRASTYPSTSRSQSYTETSLNYPSPQSYSSYKPSNSYKSNSASIYPQPSYSKSFPSSKPKSSLYQPYPSYLSTYPATSYNPRDNTLRSFPLRGYSNKAYDYSGASYEEDY